MKKSGPVAWLDRVGRPELAGGLVSVALAIALYTRYSIDGTLTHDESVPVYGGQQMVRGVAPYASIFDSKGPLATMLCGLAAAIARVVGRDDVLIMRGAFFLLSLLTVLAIYLLVVRLWHSVLAGVIAAVVFICFEGYARVALVGPNAKVPGVLLAVLAMLLASRRRWFWAGAASGLAFLDWQPLLPYMVFVALAAAASYDDSSAPGRRRRNTGAAVGGAAAALLLAVVYFASVGALGKFIEAALTFPVSGVQREHRTVGERVRLIVRVVRHYYGFGAALFWVGLALLVAAAVGSVVLRWGDWRRTAGDPLLVVLIPTLLFEAAYAMFDFQSNADVYPLLSYAAIGFGAATAFAFERLKPAPARLCRAAAATLLAAAAALSAASWIWFTDSSANDNGLLAERALGCAVDRIIEPGTSLYALGNPVPLVVTHRRNPDRFIYLNAGIDSWKVEHTDDGFAGWTAEIAMAAPSVVVLDSWSGAYRNPMENWLLAHGYQRGYLGPWQIFLAPLLQPRGGIAITRHPTAWPETGTGEPIRACRDI